MSETKSKYYLNGVYNPYMDGPLVDTIEEAYERTYWGLLHISIYVVGCFSIFFCTMSMANLLFLLPVSNPNGMDYEKLIAMDGYMYIGMALGCVLSSFFSDLCGRKAVGSFFLMGLIGIAFFCTLFDDTAVFLYSSFSTGFYAYGALIVMKVEFIEFLQHNRGFNFFCLEMFAVLGYIFSAVICRSWTTYPNLDDVFSWRYGLLIPCAFTSIITSFYLTNPPNIRVSLVTNQITDAAESLDLLHSIHSGRNWDLFPLTEDDLDGLIETLPLYHPDEIESRNGTPLLSKLIGLLCRRMKTIIRRLFRRFYKTFLLISLIRIPFYAGVFLSTIWMTNGVTVADSDWFQTFSSLYRLYHITEKGRLTIPYKTYDHYLMMTVSSLFMLIMAANWIDVKKRKCNIYTGIVMASSACFSSLLISDYTGRCFLSMIYMSGITLANVTMDLILLEDTPTATRASALGFSYVPVCLINGLTRFYSLPHKMLTVSGLGFAYLVSDYTFPYPGFTVQDMFWGMNSTY